MGVAPKWVFLESGRQPAAQTLFYLLEKRQCAADRRAWVAWRKTRSMAGPRRWSRSGNSKDGKNGGSGFSKRS